MVTVIVAAMLDRLLYGSHQADIGAESHRPTPKRAGRCTGSVLPSEEVRLSAFLLW